MDLDTALLRTFLAVADTRSFTAAAKRVHRSQSAVSMHIAKLEGLLGCTLFERNKRRVALSDAGKALLEDAERVLTAADALLGKFNEADVSGDVHFGAPEDFATGYLANILARFVQAHPNVHLHVNCDLTLNLLRDFEEGRYDLIVIKQEPEKIPPRAEPLVHEKLCWVASANWQSTRLPDVVPLILSPAPCVYRQRAIHALEELRQPWELIYTSTSVAGLIAAVRGGLGVAALPSTLVPDDLIRLTQKHGWPELQDAVICQLARENVDTPTQELAKAIAQTRH